MKSGIDKISEERLRHIKESGYGVVEDLRKYKNFELAHIASILTINNAEIKFIRKPPYMDHIDWDKLLAKSYEERLITAGALIAAQIDLITLSK